jgi:Tol biopolymer transport system component
MNVRADRHPLRIAMLTTLALAAGLAAYSAPALAAFPGVDGQIAFSSNRDTGAGDIYTVRPGQPTQRLTTSTSSSDPAYSPDGTKVAFVTAGNQIAVMNYDGTGTVALTSSATAKQQPTWSPDGSRIAYAANSFDVDGQTDLEIWAIRADGTGRVQLTENTFPDTEPAWSPDGATIAFVSARTGDANRNIYAMNADGSAQTDLTQDDEGPACLPTCYAGHDDSPAWSPDGSTIAYAHGRELSGGGVPNVWTMDASGSRASRANVSDSATSFVTPAWSPQGDRIAAVGTADGSTDRDIWVMAADGTGPQALDPDPGHDIDPDWQPVTPPVCSNVAGSGQAGQPVPLGLSCVGVGPLAFAIVTPPASGQLSAPSVTGAVTYTPNAGFSGADGFQYRASNAAGASNTAAVAVSVAAAPPSGEFSISKAKLNAKRGTARLTVAVGAPGALTLEGKGLKRARATAAAAGDVRLKVAPAGDVKKRLRNRGKATVRPEITFTPTGGSANAKRTKVKLRKRR